MGLLTSRNEDLTVTRKMADGTSVTVKSPNGSSMDLSGLLGGSMRKPMMNQGGMMRQGMMGYAQGGMMGSPVADDIPIRVTEGEFVMNVPATQKYKPMLERMNQEGRHMLAQGGWIDKAKPMGYADGGEVSPWAGYADYSPADFLEEANNPGKGVAPAGSELPGYSQPTGGAQQYPEQVVLDPTSSGREEFDRMDTLVSNRIYGIRRDNAGRAIYTLTDLGKAHNVRAVGSGVENVGVTSGGNGAADNYQPYSGVSANPILDNALQNYEGGSSGRGSINEDPGARADVIKYGQSTSAPAFTPEGNQIQYKSGQSYNVADKKQAEQFVAAGIVESGAKFITSDGITGVAG